MASQQAEAECRVRSDQRAREVLLAERREGEHHCSLLLLTQREEGSRGEQGSCVERVGEEVEAARDQWREQCEEEVLRRVGEERKDMEEEVARKVREAEERVREEWVADLAKLRTSFKVPSRVNHEKIRK